MAHCGRFVARCGLVASALLPLAVWAGDEVTGSLLIYGNDSGYLRATFTCSGLPTCTGVYAGEGHDDGCSNAFPISGGFTITGVNVAQPGTFQGTLAFDHDWTSNAPPPGAPSRPCNYSARIRTLSLPYNATWDGSTGTIAGTTFDSSGGPLYLTGNFTASIAIVPPVFPMTVVASINAATTNVTAQIQPRSQDVGTTASVFVFLHAPASSVHKRAPAGPGVVGAPLDGPDPCVLSQLDPTGQLVGVTSSSMQPLTTGVLTSQSQSIAVITNTPTPNVSGTTAYVGYGTSAGSMLAGGVYQPVINIPGTSQCTANLATAPAPAATGALTGLWWNAAESGWGIHFTQRGGNVFAAWYTYDSLGRPKWYVSTCAGFTGASGTCNGTLYEVTGPSFFGASFNPSLVNATNAGNLQVNFRDASSATMTYVAGGQSRTVSLTRQPLATGTTPPAVDYTDLWWNPSESGWGMAMAQQYGITFLAWYVYDSNGKATWQVATCTMNGSSCSGTLYRTTGPAFGPTFNSSLVQASTAGTITVNFTDANNAILTYTVDGVSASKAITRQLF